MIERRRAKLPSGGETGERRDRTHHARAVASARGAAFKGTAVI